ncbi:hypothetical protein F8M49_11025 [Rhodococcus zopfii]|uniref:O-acyltransferase WSD1 C-terminal domain-containing protein n=1 Tax=Rhodococcus zopfii TaxID=43772 RepID=A0ABU3WP64_9NOCA|nr:hypothetical protein [Rhodococcus zopfii]MDV2475766.1 hypothetical protein [Rhodococcus zopfii]
MPNSRMTVVDASYHLESQIGPHLDWPMFWAFDSGGHDAPTPSEITDHVVGRAHVLSSLRRTPRHVAGGVDYPHWVVDDTPLEDHIEHHHGEARSGMSWTEFLDALGGLTATALPRHRAWRLHVFHAVRDVPSAQGPSTVVVLNTSHALMAGPALPPVSAALFGADDMPLDLPGVGPAARRWSAAGRAAAGVLGIPAALLRWWSHLGSAPHDDAESPPARALSRFNLDPAAGGRSRAIRILTLPLSGLRPPGTTVTTAVLTAISEAMRRYLVEFDGSCPPDPTAVVTVALHDLPEEVGVNRLGPARVMLSPNVEDLDERARLIQAELAAGRRDVNSPGYAAKMQTTNLMPAVLYSAAAAEVLDRSVSLYNSGHALGHTVLTSIDCRGSERARLCGRELALFGMTPPLPRDIGLVHGVVGTARGLTLTVHSTPEAVADPDRYLELLRESIDLMGAGSGVRT